MKPSFWSRPLELSFKDVLAITFSGTFLYFCWKATGSKDALAVVQTLVPLIGIILGGYFVQESAAMWFMKSQGVQPYTTSSYGGYNTTYVERETATTGQPPDIPEKGED